MGVGADGCCHTLQEVRWRLIHATRFELDMPLFREGVMVSLVQHPPVANEGNRLT